MGRRKPDPGSAIFSSADAFVDAARLLGLVGALALLISSTSGLSAQTLPDTVRVSLAQARSLAVRANPDLLAARGETPVAAGALQQARIYPHSPRLEAEAQPSRPDGQDRRDYLIGIEQEIDAVLSEFLRGQGMAPGARLVEQRYSPTYTKPGGMLELMKQSYANGAQLSGNSWGPSDTPRGYDGDTRQVDVGVRDEQQPGEDETNPQWAVLRHRSPAP